jgi:hypothetical protein
MPSVSQLLVCSDLPLTVHGIDTQVPGIQMPVHALEHKMPRTRRTPNPGVMIPTASWAMMPTAL